MSVFIDKSCLYSTIKNTSGSSMRFGFLPPHGRQLDANEEFSVFGNVLESLVRHHRTTSRRQHESFAAAVERGDLEIQNTPAPIMTDTTTGAVKMLQVNNGTVEDVDPCWTSSISDSDGVEEIPS